MLSFLGNFFEYTIDLIDPFTIKYTSPEGLSSLDKLSPKEYLMNLASFARILIMSSSRSDISGKSRIVS